MCAWVRACAQSILDARQKKMERPVRASRADLSIPPEFPMFCWLVLHFMSVRRLSSYDGTHQQGNGCASQARRISLCAAVDSAASGRTHREHEASLRAQAAGRWNMINREKQEQEEGD